MRGPFRDDTTDLESLANEMVEAALASDVERALWLCEHVRDLVQDGRIARESERSEHLVDAAQLCATMAQNQQNSVAGAYVGVGLFVAGLWLAVGVVGGEPGVVASAFSFFIGCWAWLNHVRFQRVRRIVKAADDLKTWYRRISDRRLDALELELARLGVRVRVAGEPVDDVEVAAEDDVGKNEGER